MNTESALIEMPQQRVQVVREPFRPHEAKIRVEQFHPQLGWYSAGSLRVPLEAIPDLHRALEGIQATSAEPSGGKIIPFPEDAGRGSNCAPRG